MITDFEITYGAALAPAGYHRATRPGKVSADINGQQGGTQAYLWYSKAPGKGAAIVDVTVIYEEQSVPQGFVRVARDMSKGSGQSSYLCYRRLNDEQAEQKEDVEIGEEELPIVDIVLAHEEEASGGGFTRLDQCLCRGVEKPLYLCFRRAERPSVTETRPADRQPGAENRAWSVAALKVGDQVDIKSEHGATGVWMTGEVVELSSNRLHVQVYDGQNTIETLPYDTHKLAAPGTYMSAEDDGPIPPPPPHGQYWDWSSARCQRCRNRLWHDIRPKLQAHNSLLDKFYQEQVTYRSQSKTPSPNSAVQPPPKPPRLDEALSAFCVTDLVHLLYTIHGSTVYENQVDEVLDLLHAAQQVLIEVLKAWGPELLPVHLQRCVWLVFNCYTTIRALFATTISGTRYDSLLRHCVHVIAERRTWGTYNTYPRFNGVWLASLDNFIHAGGLTAIGHRFEHGHIRELSDYAVCYRDTLQNFTEATRKIIVEQIERLAILRLQQITDEELAYLNRGSGDLGYIDQLTNVALDIVGTKTVKADELRELGGLTLTKRLLSCPLLNARLKGISMLCELVEMAKEREETSQRVPWIGGSGARVTKVLTLEQLGDYVVEHHIVEMVLGRAGREKSGGPTGTHHELLRRIEPLLEVLAVKQRLTSAHLDALWAATQNEADTQVRIVYKVICRLANGLSLELLKGIVHRHLELLPVPYTEHQVDLMEVIGTAALKKEKDATVDREVVVPLGLPLLWHSIFGRGFPFHVPTDSMKSPNDMEVIEADSEPAHRKSPETLPPLPRAEILDKIQCILVKLCENPHVQDCFVMSCVRAIQAKRRIVQALKILGKLCEQSKFSHQLKSMKAILDGESQQDGDFIGLLARDFEEYHTAARIQAQAQSLLPCTTLEQETQLMSKCLVEGAETHSVELTVRLDFLEYICADLHRPIKYEEEFLQMWCLLVKEALCQHEMVLFLRLINPADDNRLQVGPRRPFYLDVAVLPRFFLEELSREPRILQVEVGYRCLEYYFKIANEIGEYPRPFLDRDRASKDPKALVGSDAIWMAALESESNKVAEQASALLVQLHLRRNGPIEAEEEVWRGIVRCKEEVMRMEEQEHGEKKLRRLLVLLQCFLAELKEVRRSKYRQSTLRVEVYVPRETLGLQRVVKQFTFGPELWGVKVGQLRTLLAQELQLASGKLISLRDLQTNQQVSALSEDSRYLYDYGAPTSSIAVVKRSDNHWGFRSWVLKVPDRDTSYHQPMPLPSFPEALRIETGEEAGVEGQVTADRAFWGVVFSALTKGWAISEEVWALLQLMPVLGWAQEEIRTMQGKEVVATGDAEAIVQDEQVINWEELLHGQTPVRYLYNETRIIDPTITPLADDTSPQPARQAALEWVLVFVQKGGLAFLIDTLTTWDVSVRSADHLGKAALSALIQRIRSFVSIEAVQVEDCELAEGSEVPDGPSAAEEDSMKVDDGSISPAESEETYQEGGEINEQAAANGDEDVASDDVEGGEEEMQRKIGEESRRVFASIDRQALIWKLSEVVCEVLKAIVPEEKQEKKNMDRDGGSSSGAMLLNGSRVGDDLSRQLRIFNAGGWSQPMFAQEWAETEDHKDKTAAVVQASFELAISHLTTAFCSSPHFLQLLRFGLLRCPVVVLRRVVAEGLHRVCTTARSRQIGELGSDADVVHGMLAGLMQLVDEIGEIDADGSNLDEFFVLFTRLIRAPGVLRRGAGEREQLAVVLARNVRRRQGSEASDGDEDHVMRGLFGALTTLLQRREDPEGDEEGSIDVVISSKKQQSEDEQLRLVLGVQAPGKEGINLLSELFHRCLFAAPSAERKRLESQRGEQKREATLPKCKNEETRDLALGLLRDLCKGCPKNLREVLNMLEPQHRMGLPPEEKERRRVLAARKRRNSLSANSHFARRRSGSLNSSTGAPMLTNQQAQQLALCKSKTGYVGLKNLGCICYMNSTLQQFFHIKGFREGVFAFEDHSEDRDESLMFQLQSLFAHLQESDKPYINPKGFCQAFKNWEGEPTDVFLQQDASEFLTMFFQQVEGLIQGGRCDSLLRDYFVGTFSNELIAKGNRYSERPEPFYFCGVEVRNMKNLYQALDAFVAGETVEYTWESKDAEGQTVKELLPTTKRLSIKALPRHLIIHLKRFEFDYDSLQQTKINDRFEFPLELNMFPYTLEGRHIAEQAVAKLGPEEVTRKADEYYRYHLAGVVVHMGTAHSGHYYSYIRERGNRRGWFEFNDTVVSAFDPKDLEVECYGGQETNPLPAAGHSRMSFGSGWIRERIRNAFMLVYDRCDLEGEAVLPPFPPPPPPERASDSMLVDREDSGASEASAGHKLGMDTVQEPGDDTSQVPRPILEEILRENLDFWRKTNILTEQYFNFMDSLLYDFREPLPLAEKTEEGPELVRQGLRLMSLYLLGTLMEAKAYDSSRRRANTMQDQMRAVSGSCADFPEVAIWLLATLVEGPEGTPRGEILWDLLTECEEAEGRRLVGCFISDVLTALQKSGCPDTGEVWTAFTGVLLSTCQAVYKAPRDRIEPYLRVLDTCLCLRDEGRVELHRDPQSIADILQLFAYIMRNVMLADMNNTAQTPSYGPQNRPNNTTYEQIALTLPPGKDKPVKKHPNFLASTYQTHLDTAHLDSVVLISLLDSTLRSTRIHDVDSPVALPPHQPLPNPSVICHLYDSLDFWHRLIALILTAKHRERLQPLFAHLLWERDKVPTLHAQLQQGIQYCDVDDPGEKPFTAYLRALILICQVNDAFQQGRIMSYMKATLVLLEGEKQESVSLKMLIMLSRTAYLCSAVRDLYRTLGLEALDMEEEPFMPDEEDEEDDMPSGFDVPNTRGRIVNPLVLSEKAVLKKSLEDSIQRLGQALSRCGIHQRIPRYYSLYRPICSTFRSLLECGEFPAQCECWTRAQTCGAHNGLRLLHRVEDERALHIMCSSCEAALMSRL